MNPHKTAITRKKPSRPCKTIEHLLTPTVVDYGCGKGEDKDYLNSKGVLCLGYDKYNPEYNETKPSLIGRTVMCNFVLNTIPLQERIEVINDLKQAENIFISVRTDKVKGKIKDDGVITSKGTFQTQLKADEWLSFFREHLGDEVNEN